VVSKDTWIYFDTPDGQYTIRYEAPTLLYDKYQPALERLLETFKWKPFFERVLGIFKSKERRNKSGG
jgi:hypothetical protein